MSQDPIPTIVQGFNWTSAGAWASFIALLGIIARQVNPWRTQSVNAEQRLRDDLLKRVVKLEGDLEAERTRHAATRERDRIRTEAERSLNRHQLNNITGCFDAFLMLVKANPDKAAQAVAMVEEMRAKQIVAEAAEKAAIHAADLAYAEEEAKL